MLGSPACTRASTCVTPPPTPHALSHVFTHTHTHTRTRTNRETERPCTQVLENAPYSQVSASSRVAVCCSVSQCAAVCCSVLQCVAVCHSVLQCVATRCSAHAHVLANRTSKKHACHPQSMGWLWLVGSLKL